VRLSDVEAMQSQIVDTVRRLEETGQIVVAGGGSEQLVT
jgi:flagellar motor switch protein FliG